MENSNTADERIHRHIASVPQANWPLLAHLLLDITSREGRGVSVLGRSRSVFRAFPHCVRSYNLRERVSTASAGMSTPPDGQPRWFE